MIVEVFYNQNGQPERYERSRLRRSNLFIETNIKCVILAPEEPPVLTTRDYF